MFTAHTNHIIYAEDPAESRIMSEIARLLLVINHKNLKVSQKKLYKFLKVYFVTKCDRNITKF